MSDCVHALCCLLQHFRTQRRTWWQRELAGPQEVVPPPWEGTLLSASYIQCAVGAMENEVQRGFQSLLRACCPVNQLLCLTKPFKAYHPEKSMDKCFCTVCSFFAFWNCLSFAGDFYKALTCIMFSDFHLGRGRWGKVMLVSVRCFNSRHNECVVTYEDRHK